MREAIISLMENADYEIYDSSNLRKTLNEYGDKIKDALDYNNEIIKETAQKLGMYDEIVISGCGDKFTVPLITQYLADSFTKINLRIIHSRILANYTPEWISPKTLIIFLTASGTTTDVLDAIREVKKKNAGIIVITQLIKKGEKSVYTELKGYRNSQIIIPLKNGKVTWPSTTTFHTFLAILNALFIYYLENQGVPADALLTLQYLDLPEYMDELSNNKNMHDWCILTAKQLLSIKPVGFYFLGDGPRYAAARRGALVNFVENCKEDSFPIESEEFVHLVIETLADVNVTKNVLILLKPRSSYVSKQANNRFEEIKSLWEEKAGKDKIVIIDPFQFVTPKGIGKKNDILLTPLYVLMLEWLAYYYAINKKQDPSRKEVKSFK